MGLFDFIFGTKSKEPVIKKTVTVSAKPSAQSKYSFKENDEYYTFYDRNYDKWDDKFAEAIDIDESSEDPDKTLRNYEKAFPKLEALRDKLCSIGPVGIRMYEEEFKDYFEILDKDMKEFKEYDYEELKKNFDENKAYQAAIKKDAAKLLKIIEASNEPVLQVDLKKEAEHYELAISRLVDKGKIERIKIGNKVAFQKKP